KASRFYQKAIRPGASNQLIQANLHGQSRNTTHAATRNFPDNSTFGLEYCAVNAHFTKFIHQHGPNLALWFLTEQVDNGGGFTNTQKTKNQVGGNRADRRQHKIYLKNVII